MDEEENKRIVRVAALLQEASSLLTASQSTPTALHLQGHGPAPAAVHVYQHHPLCQTFSVRLSTGQGKCCIPVHVLGFIQDLIETKDSGRAPRLLQDPYLLKLRL